MKKIVTILTVVLSSLAFSQTLLETIDLPSGNFYKYGYGLVYNAGEYWISSSHYIDGKGIIKAVDNTGSEVDVLDINYPSMKESQGLAFDGTNFWYVERKTARCDLFKVAPDGTVLDSIPTATIGGPYYVGGAAWDGTGLWISVYYPNNEAALYKVDVNTKTIVDTIQTFGTQPEGITVNGDTLFYVMDDFEGDPEKVYAVSLSTKDTLYSFHVPDQSSQSPRGLAWDGTYFWLLAEPVGASSGRQLFKYDLGGGGTPQIYVPVSEINFPNTTVGNPSSYVLTVYNNGSATLTVDSITVSGSVFSIDSITFPVNIPAGQSMDVTVNFAPTGYDFYQGSLTIFNNDPVNLEVTVDLYGQGVLSGPVIALPDDYHNFGDLWVAGNSITSWDFKVYNMGDQTLEISSMAFSLPEYSYGSYNFPIQIPSTDTISITIFFAPTEAGEYIDTLKINNNDPNNPVATVAVEGNGVLGDYNYGYMFWNYQVPPNPNTNFDEYRVEGLKPINDITGDGVNEVIIATDNYLLICLNGAGGGSTVPVWTFNSYFSPENAGSIGQSWDYGVQDAIQIANDLNGDGFNDVVIGTGGSNEHVYAIDGTNGEIIWQFGNDFNYGLGDFEAVDVRRDFNGDGVEDVLAIADGNQEGTGYKSAYLFDGTNGDIIWQYYYPGPNQSFGKTIISINDVTNDNIPDAVIAIGNNGVTNLSVIGLDGSNGQPLWTKEMQDWEPKELLELPLSPDTSDVIAVEYFAHIYRLDGRTGAEVWHYTLGGLSGIIQIALIDDINKDNVPDVLIASFAGNGLNCLSGADGSQLWSYQMDFQYGVAAVPDIDFDGVQDVVTGDQTGTFYAITGTGDSLLFSHTFSGDRINTVNVMPSIDGNYSYELLAGTKNGLVACFSGGVDTSAVFVEDQLMPTEFKLYQNYPNPFNPTTKIKFEIPTFSKGVPERSGGGGLATLKVYDILGNEIATLLNKQLTPGTYEVTFDASSLASGVYIYQLRSGGFIQSKKMILLK